MNIISPLSYFAAFFAGFAVSAVSFAGPIAYVPNERSGTLSLIDTDTDAVVGEIRTGGKPRGIVVSADGKRLYVSDQSTNALLVVDIAARAVSSRVELGESPEGVGISADGRWVAAASELRTRVTAALTLVRTRRCACSRKNSSVCSFGWIG